jgi:hypothetical protein
MVSLTNFSTKIYPVIDFINKIDSRLFIFLILCLNLLSFVPGNNEETYFAIAKQYMDPTWIPGSFTFTEWVGTRFLFQNIAGLALKFISFEQLTFWGRMINFACYAFPLALIFKELNIRNLGIFCILQLYIRNIGSQNFFGMEWIFGGFEGKTIAYIFVFYGVYSLLKGKYEWGAFFAALASYFHILVGGWFFVLVFIYAFVSSYNIKRLFYTGIVYVVIVSPFVFYLVQYLDNSDTIINGVDIDWVYSFFRNPHHTAPMHRIGAMHKVLPRVVFSFIILLFCIFYFRKYANEYIHKLNNIVIITLCMVFVGLIITYVDVNGRILKYYLFRIAGIGMFSCYLMIFLFLREKLDGKFNPVNTRVICFLLVGVFALFQIGKNFSRNIFPKENKELVELTTFFTTNTNPDDIYLFLDEDELSFSRRTQRDAFVIFKFDPGGGEKIYEWYTREQMRRELRKNLSYIEKIKEDYRLDYLITRESVNDKHLKPVFNNHKYYLYEVTSSK